MNKESITDGIMEPGIVAVYSLKDIILHHSKYWGLPPKGSQLVSVAYCQVRDIKDSCLIEDKKISIHIDFNLLMVYEYIIEGIRNYKLFVDKLHKNISIDRKLYGLPKNNLKGKNTIHDIKYHLDLDSENNLVTIEVRASIKCLLLEDGAIVHYDKSWESTSNVTVWNHENSSTWKAANLSNLIKEPAGDFNDISQLKEDIKEIKSQLSDIGDKYERIKSHYYKLYNMSEEKDFVISKLKTSLNQKVALLESAYDDIYKNVKFLTKEVEKLKDIVDKEKDQDKIPLNSKIQAAINAIRSYF